MSTALPEAVNSGRSTTTDDGGSDVVADGSAVVPEASVVVVSPGTEDPVALGVSESSSWAINLKAAMLRITRKSPTISPMSNGDRGGVACGIIGSSRAGTPSLPVRSIRSS